MIAMLAISIINMILYFLYLVNIHFNAKILDILQIVSQKKKRLFFTPEDNEISWYNLKSQYELS